MRIKKEKTIWNATEQTPTENQLKGRWMDGVGAGRYTTTGKSFLEKAYHGYQIKKKLLQNFAATRIQL